MFCMDVQMVQIFSDIGTEDRRVNIALGHCSYCSLFSTLCEWEPNQILFFGRFAAEKNILAKSRAIWMSMGDPTFSRIHLDLQ